MTRPECAARLQRWLDGDQTYVPEDAIEAAVGHLRSPAHGAAEMREAAMPPAEVALRNALIELAYTHPQFGGLLPMAEEAIRAIRSLPLPAREVPSEPAAPAVGEDEALLARIDSVIQEYLLSSLRISQERAVHKMEGLLVDLGTRLRTALADVEIMEHNARVGGLREEELERERDEARAALAAAMAERDALAKRLEFHDSLQAGIDEYNRARAGRNDG